MFPLDEIREQLVLHPAALQELEDRSRAAVALILCAEGPDLEVLFIERTRHDQDPWSGHLGFPGGRVDAEDPGPREAAERETREEIGLDLITGEYLGRLDDLSGAYHPIVISCFVYGLRKRPTLTLDAREVADAFWFPLPAVLEPERHGEEVFLFCGENRNHPAVQLLEEGRPQLWGITYRLLSRFLEVMGSPFPG